MMPCTQCHGKGATVGKEAIIDLNSNTSDIQKKSQGDVPCSQCNGRGYMTGGSF